MTEATTTPATLVLPTSTHHATVKKATALDAMLRAEYPALLLGTRMNEDQSKVVGWIVSHEPSATIISDTAKVPELADLLDLCEEADLDPTEEEEAEEEPKLSGSVVPERYRQEYREKSSNGQSCGDWLAEWLVAQTHGTTGFMVADFEAILDQNGIDRSRGWGLLPTSGQKGWVGRYRMNGRQVLEKVAAKQGHVTSLVGTVDHLPEGDLAILRAKHATWLAKEAKREAAAAASIKEAVEGPTAPAEEAAA